MLTLRRIFTTHLPLLTGVGCGLAVLLTRTWGLHIDDASYFYLAVHEPMGDTARSGKPYLFYVFNYRLYHLFRAASGWLHPLILPVFYVMVTVVALWRLAGSSTLTGARRGWTFALLLLSPFVLFNATQLMMETAQLPLLTIALAALLAMSEGKRETRTALWLGLTAMVATLLKETSMPALAVLAVAFLPILRLRLWPLALGTVAGFFGNKLLLWAISAPPSFHYGGFAQVLTSLTDAGQWKKVPSSLGMWAFFVGLTWIGALWSWWERRDAISKTLLAVTALSVGGVVLVQFASDPRSLYARYGFPVLWVGLAASAIACARAHKRWVAGAALAFQLPWVTALWPGVFPTIRYWPEVITTESYASGGTIMSGTPIYGWIATSPSALSDLCVYLPRARAAGDIYAEQWFQTIAAKVTFYDERNFSEFTKCAGAKAIVDRRFGVNSCLAENCAVGQYSIHSCLDQDLRFFSPSGLGLIQSHICLP